MALPDKKNIDLSSFVKEYSSEIAKAFNCIDLKELEKISELLSQKIKEGKKIYSCGNGGQRLFQNILFVTF